MISLHNKRPAQTKLQGVTLLDKDVEWPENFKMVLKVTTQTANDYINYVVEYEIVEAPEVPARIPWRWPW